MLRRSFAILVLGLAALPVMTASARMPIDEVYTTEAIRKALVRLPYYGVFDFLSFQYDRGVVTLSGYAYGGALKGDAARAVKKVAGVDEVVNQIELLPASSFDDGIRWATFYNIYGDSYLSRYAAGGGLTRLDFRFRRFPGQQPFGDYPIHIVVNRGHTRLLGVVDQESDKIVAGLRAREIFGTFTVSNELLIPNRGTR